jgi:predicted enzyme related to lactoylglutathione lyase
MDPVVHFEIPYDEAERIARFYQAAFGWKIKMLGEEMGNYVLATTARTGADGRPKQGGTINGGFYAKKPDWPAQHPSVVIAVDDIVDAMDRVSKAGGRVLGEPMEIPGVGGYVSFMDTEGNRVSLLQPLPMPKASNKKRAAPGKRAVQKKKASGRSGKMRK